MADSCEHLRIECAELRDAVERLSAERSTAIFAADEARDQIADLERQLHSAIERGREEANVVAERLVFALHIYGGYNINSRGPGGCLFDAIKAVAPSIAQDLSELGADATYAKHWDEDGAKREDATPSADTPIGETIDALVTKLHELRRAPTDTQGIERTAEILIDHVHGLALALQDTRWRLRKLEERVWNGAKP